ncbi:MAG: zinc dependent phospholipase C family protein [Caloramator sp.]|nr:zinc dependent phospholipase C family protein [Caloramator sp.]
MLSSTHLLIAENILSILNNNFVLILDNENFKTGCIMPDYSLSMFFIPHYKEKSFDFVVNIIDELLKFNDSNMSIFSRKLGVIMHFLSDYFCRAHNDKNLDSLLNHFKYERKLHSEFLRLPIKDIYLNTLYKLDNTVLNSSYFITKYINDMHMAYLKAEPSMVEDIKYSLEVCTVICYSIITHNKYSIIDKIA